MSEIPLQSPPTDGISSLTFAPTSNNLLVTSWDSNIRVYDAANNKLLVKYEHQAPVLDGAFTVDGVCYSGGLDRTLHRYEIATGTLTTVGTHEDAVRRIVHCPPISAIVTGSWDKTVQAWDSRGEGNIAKVSVSDKVFAMSACADKVVVGTADRQVYVFDVRRWDTPISCKESPLKYQTRYIECFPDGHGYALSSIEGRVAIEYFDQAPEVQAMKFAFKCHRPVVNDTEVVYPVNAISFHPTYGTFATGGGDGIVNVWDARNKKRICQFHKYNTSIASLAFNNTGSLLAIAVSYSFEEGEKEHPSDQVLIRPITDTDVKPKARTQ
eukprot:TRINITY_DN12168_c0_g1::TRINITY_DN12168_c0_g1_i1::g.26496::m.26496 TRINITY_DN12168_c0_g1::TRINITY_DN12168_c0_g1_i1::g.26496  ORF type:complete len:345 (-),score=33.26,sp/Q9WVA3/BUB3_MOUSE/52.02/2e-116,WD40/PF00400.27/0.00056,WD40/PF00400.27/3.7,WD40/PF00400.27/6.7e-05,WD40/PF00400.27/1.6e+02,WD40/PF00400.27/3.3e-06,WD40/PF00400.27/9.2e+02,PQQ_2/PF13360.1/2.3e-05,PQQ/PF01011.16/0.061,PQQ/PF01011.16/60,PQQ_3/PF13570.1/68,PQQ_3/PF13570.1/3.1e+02,PQQ_3/PF13570.1/4.2e+03,PQQ_3/PF13570.1/0.98,PQQ_3/PF1